MELGYFYRQRPKIMVVSHERSGTHFLMNSIAKCFGYLAAPWVNLDSPTGINFHYPDDVAGFFTKFQGRSLANIVKSHHSFGFFKDILPVVTSEFHIFYIYRDPRDVMVSFWRFLNRIRWNEGPKAPTVKEFIRGEPSGNMLRYQMRQRPTMIHRWRAHVDGWTTDVPEQFRSKVTLIRYRNLHDRYEETMRSFAPILGEPTSIVRPSLSEPSIFPNSGIPGAYSQHLDAEDLALFREIAGPTMDRLGFTDNSEPRDQENRGQTGGQPTSDQNLSRPRVPDTIAG